MDSNAPSCNLRSRLQQSWARSARGRPV